MPPSIGCAPRGPTTRPAPRVHALQRTMHDDPPAAFLYWEQASRAVSRRFVLPAGDDVDILRSVDRWRLVDRRAAGAGAP